jgi:hypothetical protein
MPVGGGNEVGRQAIDTAPVAVDPPLDPGRGLVDDLADIALPTRHRKRVAARPHRRVAHGGRFERPALERKRRVPLGAAEKLKMQVPRDRGARLEAVVETDVPGYALRRAAKVEQEARKVDAAGAVHIPFLGNVLVGRDDHVVGQQRERVHPRMVLVAGRPDLETDLGILLLPANVLAAQETTAVDVCGAGGRRSYARTVEAQRPLRIVLDTEEPVGVLGMAEHMTLDAGEVVLDEPGLALMDLELGEHGGKPAAPRFHLAEAQIEFRPGVIVSHLLTHFALPMSLRDLLVSGPQKPGFN